MKNSSAQKQRILQYLNYKLISKNKFYIETGISNGTLDKKSGLTMETFEKLYSKYPDINLEWLITGRGPMLRLVEENEENVVTSPQTLRESQIDHNKAQEPKPIACRDCKEKERIIQGLETRLVDKDKQIESLEHQIRDLKNNLGMVIASKDAMLAMKEEAIKDKNEIVRIQSRRIAELESHRELEEAKKIYFDQTMSGNVMSSKRGALPDVVRIEEKKSPRTEKANF